MLTERDESFDLGENKHSKLSPINHCFSHPTRVVGAAEDSPTHMDAKELLFFASLHPPWTGEQDALPREQPRGFPAIERR